jgi:hypothetical protein
MEQEKIKYKDWRTGEEKVHITSDITYRTGLICPFDNIEILDRNFYHNEHDTYCPGCRMSYSSKYISQEKVNLEAIQNAQRYKKEILTTEKNLKELEEKKADLEARIKHAEEVGLIRKVEDEDSIEDGDISP